MDDKMNLPDRYKILVEARNFHYDNFNKWMTYFYVAIAALFVGYCTIVSINVSECHVSTIEKSKLEVYIVGLGFITSLFWYWSAKGYYYWNINFITLINHYEKNLLKFDDDKRIYFVFADKKMEGSYSNPTTGANISTSKVTVLFAFIVASSWGTILLSSLIKKQSVPVLILLSLGSVILLSQVIPYCFLKSDIGKMPDLKLDSKP